MRPRTIVVGDIHGCFDELTRLLAACDVSPEDEVVSVGDLVDRGPEPLAVVRFFRSRPRAFAVLGNHEDKHVRLAAGEPLRPGRSQRITKRLLGAEYDDAVAWFRTLPLWLERHGCLVVHAGLVPGLPVEQQPRSALLRGLMPWMKDIFDATGPSWQSLYDGRIPIVFGHSTRPSVAPVNNAWGIDTGACHGRRLSALVLPEFRVVDVEARRDYWAETSARHESEPRLERAERKQARKAALAARGPLVVEGIAIDGRWLLARLGLEPSDAGPWLGKLIAELRRGVQDGAVDSVEDVDRLLRAADPA